MGRVYLVLVSIVRERTYFSSVARTLSSYLIFFNDVVRDGQCGYVLGPPGSGKSATAAAFALTLARTGWAVTWIRLSHSAPSVCVQLNGNSKRTAYLRVCNLAAKSLIQILSYVDDSKEHVVILDNVTADDNAVTVACIWWLMKNRPSRRLAVVTSMASRGKYDEQGERIFVGVREHFVSSWTLAEYLEAVEDDELFGSVRTQLDSSDDLEPDEAHLTPTWRQTLVRSKYYFAGGNVRYMFDRSTAAVVESLDRGVDWLWNIAAGLAGVGSGTAIDRLFCRFEMFDTPGCALAIVGGPVVIKYLASVLQDDSSSAMDGRILEMYFFARLRNGGVTLYEGENTITWPQGRVLVVDPENLPALPRVGWFKPHKYNQGGYDAVYLDVELKLLRFVQVARANSHTLHIRYLNSLLASLQASASSFEINTLEIFVIIERKALPAFTYSTITGEDLVAAFPAWEINEARKNVRLVGIDGVASWNDFDC